MLRACGTWKTVLILGVLASPLRADEPALQNLLEQAASLTQEDKWEDALEALERVVQRKEEDRALAARAQLHIGQYRLHMAIPDVAEEELKKVVAAFPEQVETVNWARLSLVDALNYQGKPGEAAEAAEALLLEPTAAPKQLAWCRVKLGQLLQRLDRTEEALDILGQLDSQFFPDGDVGPRVHGGLARAEILLAQRRFQAATPVLEQIIAEAEGQHVHLRNWARLRLIEVHFDTASWAHIEPLADDLLADHAAGQASEQQRLWAMVWKARTLERVGRLAEAEQIAHQAVAAATAAEQHDLVYEALAVPGRIYLESERWAEARQTWEEAITVAHERNATQLNWARVHLLQALITTGSLDRAEQVFSELLADHAAGAAEDGHLAWALVFRADGLIRAEHYEEARGPLEMATALGYLIGQNTDDLCLQAAEQLLKQGARERALAWLRMGIEDPSRLQPSDEELVDRIGRLLDDEEALEWYAYLADPVGRADPLSGHVMAEFGAVSPEPTSPDVKNTFVRDLWLGRCYVRGRHFAAARQVFEDALAQAESPRQKAEALAGMASVFRRQRGNPSALETAHQAAGHWLQALPAAAHDGEAHYVINMAAATYAMNGFPEQASEILEEIMSSVSATTEPSRACFVRFRLMQEYICQGRDAEAKEIAESTLGLFLDNPFPQGHDLLVSHTLIHLAFIEGRMGDLASAFARLDELEARWPGRFTPEIPAYQDEIQAQMAYLQGRTER